MLWGVELFLLNISGFDFCVIQICLFYFDQSRLKQIYSIFASYFCSRVSLPPLPPPPTHTDTYLQFGCVFHTSTATQFILDQIVVRTRLDWRNTSQLRSITQKVRFRWSSTSALMFTKSTFFSLYSPFAPRPCGSFQYPRSFPSSSSSRSTVSSQTEGITTGCGSAVLIRRSFVSFTAGVCSRYCYLQSQLRWQHTQRILGSLLNT